MLGKAPATIEKLKGKARDDFTKLTMDELKAVAVVYFNGVKLTGDKAAHVHAFQQLVNSQPATFNRLIAAAATPAAATATAAVPPTVFGFEAVTTASEAAGEAGAASRVRG